MTLFRTGGTQNRPKPAKPPTDYLSVRVLCPLAFLRSLWLGALGALGRVTQEWALDHEDSVFRAKLRMRERCFEHGGELARDLGQPHDEAV